MHEGTCREKKAQLRAHAVVDGGGSSAAGQVSPIAGCMGWFLVVGGSLEMVQLLHRNGASKPVE